MDLRNLALVPALSIRFGGDFRVGFAPGFLFSTGRLMFREELALDGGSAGLTATACGVPAAPRTRAPRRATTSTRATASATPSSRVTLGAGIYYRRRAVEFGLAYQSRPLGSDVSGVEVAGERTTVTLPPRHAGRRVPVTCPNGQSTRCVFGDISYRLPDVWIAGATWRLRPGLELTAMVRWLWLQRPRPHRRSPLGAAAGRRPQHAPARRALPRLQATSGTRACASPTGGASGSGSARCCASRPAPSMTTPSTRRPSTASSCSRSG